MGNWIWTDRIDAPPLPSTRSGGERQNSRIRTDAAISRSRSSTTWTQAGSMRRPGANGRPRLTVSCRAEPTRETSVTLATGVEAESFDRPIRALMPGSARLAAEPTRNVRRFTGQQFQPAPNQQPIPGRDAGGNHLCPHAVALGLEAHRAHDVNRDRALYPSGQVACVAGGDIVTARQDSDARAGCHRTIQDTVGQDTARVARDDDVRGVNLDVLQGGRDKCRASRQSRPRQGQRFMQYRG